MHLMPMPAKKTDAASPVKFDRLTEAQYRILKLLDLGFSNQEIADRLGITVGTVKWHLHHLFDKLQVTSRGKAIALAREAGLV
jgi:LuxR family maltose regulon positive regulatory protein